MCPPTRRAAAPDMCACVFATARAHLSRDLWTLSYYYTSVYNSIARHIPARLDYDYDVRRVRKRLHLRRVRRPPTTSFNSRRRAPQLVTESKLIRLLRDSGSGGCDGGSQRKVSGSYSLVRQLVLLNDACAHFFGYRHARRVANGAAQQRDRLQAIESNSYSYVQSIVFAQNGGWRPLQRRSPAGTHFVITSRISRCIRWRKSRTHIIILSEFILLVICDHKFDGARRQTDGTCVCVFVCGYHDVVNCVCVCVQCVCISPLAT